MNRTKFSFQMKNVKFNKYSDEEMCEKVATSEKYAVFGGIACARTRNHEGSCIGIVCDAAFADGVRFCCRAPLRKPHFDWCDKIQERIDNETFDRLLNAHDQGKLSLKDFFVCVFSRLSSIHPVEMEERFKERPRDFEVFREWVKSVASGVEIFLGKEKVILPEWIKDALVWYQKALSKKDAKDTEEVP